jgi:Xaa-Pro aminopeptidase
MNATITASTMRAAPPIWPKAPSRLGTTEGASSFSSASVRIYIPAELGIRHEDTVAVTEEGCENLAPKWSGTPEEPAVV